ncbi:hypothetical protein EYF80_022180 [Liparis tanakae]|uniref:Uncharacterized protein n=1 Tax=Liparis tanakae TaxID=230148 RepID=A0A4Z2HPV9_9TELE|nr:hypothetical protein EYF80_022180 [Liparis tanakae]
MAWLNQINISLSMQAVLGFCHLCREMAFHSSIVVCSFLDRWLNGQIEKNGREGGRSTQASPGESGGPLGTGQDEEGESSELKGDPRGQLYNGSREDKRGEEGRDVVNLTVSQ